MTQTLGNVLLAGVLAYLSYFVAVSLTTVRRAANKSLLTSIR